ncbi:MAG TPA: hypothetical protein VFF33_13295 [Ignavibacteriaceae bacterium]|nr:hypothetical protein [Ignavibacteriaceae bacterium]
MKKNISKISLIIITILIWFFVFRYLFQYLLNDDKEEVLNSSFKDSTEVSSKRIVNEFTPDYKEIKRNPFEFSSDIKEEEDYPIVDSFVKEKSYFHYKILGVIEKDNYRSVIIEDLDDNKLLYLQKGDVYKSLKIKFITIKEVILIDNNSEKTIIIDK